MVIIICIALNVIIVIIIVVIVVIVTTMMIIIMQVLMLTGEYMSRSYPGQQVYAKSRNLVIKLRQAYDHAFQTVDVLAMPTIPHTAIELLKKDATLRGTSIDLWEQFFFLFGWGGPNFLESLIPSFQSDKDEKLSKKDRHFSKWSTLK